LSLSRLVRTLSVAAAPAVIAFVALAARPGPALAASAPPPPPPAALDILKASIAYRTLPGNGQVPAYAQYLAGVLTDAGFEPADIRIGHVGTGAEETATLTARFPGRNPKRKPILLIGHLDVVDARREDWKRDPFTATVEGGYIYGRGAYDNKFEISAMVAALTKLKQSGFRPGRDVVLALTGDEETTARSTQVLAAQLKGAEFALNGDAGGGILAEDGSGGVIYQIQAGEKTYVDMTLTVTDAGGHSSRPTQTNAIYRLSRALTRLDAWQFPVLTNELTTAYFRESAPNTPGAAGEAMKRYVANPADQDAIAVLSGIPAYVGQLRTTCVATQLSAGHAPNALPQRAVANVNCRIFPGTSAASVQQKLREVIADPSISVTYSPEFTFESSNSPLRPDVMAAVRKAVQSRYPKLPIVPVMGVGSTDGTHFRAAGVPTYGVAGGFMKKSDDFAHGLDERMPVDAMDGAVAHWESLVRDLAR
jgi:carboxypeptidase PM20D1